MTLVKNGIVHQNTFSLKKSGKVSESKAGSFKPKIEAFSFILKKNLPSKNCTQNGHRT